MEWSQTLRSRREALGLSRAQLAARSGVSPDTIRRIEVDGDVVKPSTRVALDKALELSEPADRVAQLEAEVAALRAQTEALRAQAEIANATLRELLALLPPRPQAD